MNEPEESIPRRLAQEIVRVGSLELWEFQAFAHHDHPTIGGEGDVELEMAIVDLWSQILRSRFPEMSFIIQVNPTDRMTWYQVTPNAPTTDEAEFEIHTASIRFTISREVPSTLSEDRVAYLKDALKAAGEKPRRTGGEGCCERCGALDNFSAVKKSPIHRGVLLVQCLACGAELIHSTRVIRNRIGPVELSLG